MESFPDWLQRKFSEWEKSRGGRRQPYIAFARYLGVSQPSLNRWMMGDNLPTGDNIRLLADKLGPEVYEVLELVPPLPRILREAGELYRVIPAENRGEFTEYLEVALREWAEEHGYKFKRVK